MTPVHPAPSWPADLQLHLLPVSGATLALRVAGTGPTVLLLHGTGTAGFSFAPLVHQLAPHCTCLVPDLPGHGLSSLPTSLADLGVEGMATAVLAALAAKGVHPDLIVGHSAGFVVGVELMRRSAITAPRLVGLAPALWLSSNPRRSPFWPLIAAVSRSRLLAALLARAVGSRAAVERIAAATGSSLPPEHLAAYATLATNPRHLHAMLAMMAAWDLVPIQRAAACIMQPVLLLAGDRDPWFPPANVAFQASHFPRGASETFAGLGHFLHEEQPVLLADRLRAVLAAPI